MANVVGNVSGVFNGKRLSAFDSTGRLWVAVLDTANSRWGFWYSDNGTSYTEATSLRITSTTAAYASFDIDGRHERLTSDGGHIRRDDLGRSVRRCDATLGVLVFNRLRCVVH